jgi:hypothetical protein
MPHLKHATYQVVSGSAVSRRPGVNFSNTICNLPDFREAFCANGKQQIVSRPWLFDGKNRPVVL